MNASEHVTDPVLGSRGSQPAVAFNLRGRDGGSSPEEAEAASLRASSGGSSRSYIAQSSVRRLTPTECERLQGFPDGYTAGQKDSPRYRQLGNAVAVPVAEWLGRRIIVATL
jgi:DNA (cytosine-5)-methyltransferase 1